MSTLYRAQILLEQQQHQALSRIARREGRSMSELVREIVGGYLEEQEQQARLQKALQAIEQLTQTRGRLREQHGILPAELLAEARAEREQDLERVWRSVT